MLVPLERITNDVIFGLGISRRKWEVVLKANEDNKLSKLDTEIMNLAVSTLSALRKYKEGNINAAKYLDKESRNPSDTEEDKKSFSKKVTRHVEMAEAAEAFYKILYNAHGEFIQRNRKAWRDYADL